MGEHLKLNNVNGSILSFNTDIEKPLENLKINFSPVQEGIGTPSLENVRPIRGWTGINIGKSQNYHIFEPSGTMPMTESGITLSYLGNGRYRMDGVNNTENNIHFIVPIQPILHDATFVGILYYNSNKTFINDFQIRLRRSNETNLYNNYLTYDNSLKNYVSTTNAINDPVPNIAEVRFTARPGQGDYEFQPIIVFCGENQPDSYSYYANYFDVKLINWQSEAGTIYGGYVDLVSGEVVSNTSYRILNGTDDSTSSQYTNYGNYSPIGFGDTFGAGRRFTITVDNAIDSIICDSLPIYTDTTSEDFPYLYVTQQGNFVYYMIIMGKASEHSEITNAATAIQYTSDWLKEHPVTIVWERTPYVSTTLSTTPSITPFLGANNIWSSANGDIQASYYQRVYSHITDDNILTINDGVEAPIDSLKVHFTPIQEGSGDPSPTNVRLISGWTGLDACISVVNVWDEQWEIGGINNSGQETSGSKQIRAKNYIPCIPNTKYRIIYDPIEGRPDGSTDMKLQFYDKNKQLISTDWRGRNYLPTSPNNACYMRFVMSDDYGTVYKNDISINYPYTVTDYHPYTGTITPISWQSEAGTVYGGYVDLVSGEIVAEWLSMDMSTLTWTVKSNNNIYWFYASKQMPVNLWYPDVDAASNNSYKAHIMFDKYKTVASAHIYNGSSGDNCIGLDWTYPNASIRIRDDSYNQDIDSFTTSMNNATLYYELATPITIATIAPTPLSTIKGINNIWSNANSYIEADYYKPVHEKINLLRHNAIISAPHLVTSTPADVVTFSTDLAAPMKECKCEFFPVQDGSGDPSPTNMRAISGWTGIGIFSTPLVTKLKVKNFSSTTSNGVTTSLTNDGRIVFDGIANAVCVFNFDVETFELNNYTNRMLARMQNRNSSQTVFYAGIFNDNTSLGTLTYDYMQFYDDVCCTLITGDNSYYVNKYRWPISKDTGNYSIAPILFNYEALEKNSINWSSEAGTVYGGYVDLVKGEVVQTWASIDLGTLNWIYAPNPTNALSNTYIFYNSSTIYPLPKKLYSGIVSSYKWVNRYQDMSVDKTASYIYSTSVAIRDDDYTDAGTFKSAMSGVQLVYELATPIHTPITPAVLNTLKGTNNVWSSANGPVTIKYWTH